MFTSKRCVEKDFVITRFINICWYFFKIAAVCAVFVAVGLGVFLFTRLDDEIRRQAEQFLAKELPHINVSIGGARLVEGQGVAFYDLTVSETSSTQLQSNLLVVDEIMFFCDASLTNLVNGLPEVNRVVVRHPQVWLAKSREGGWNFSNLLPLPECKGKKPEIVVHNAQVTLVDQSRDNLPPLSLRDANLTIRPQSGTAPGAKQPIEINGSFGGPHVERAELSARCDPATQSMQIRGKVQQLQITQDLLAWAADISGQSLDQTNVLGKVDGEIEVQHQLGQNAPPIVQADLQVREARIEDPRLPRPVVDLSCHLHCENQLLSVRDLKANCGTASLALQLDRRGWSATAPTAIGLRLENVELEEKLYCVLPPMLQTEWDKYQPTGVVDAVVQATFDGQKWHPTATLTGRDLEFESDKFRYRVNHGSGTMKYSPLSETLPATLDINLVGNAGGQTLSFVGQIFNPKPGAVGWIEVTGQNVKIEDRMIAALPDKARHVIESMHPQGKFNLRWRLDRTQLGQPKPHTSLRLELLDCRVNYDKFPYPLSGVNGLILAEDQRWTFRDLATTGSRSIQCQGYLHPLDDQPTSARELFLRFTGQQVPLNNDLQQALPPTVQRAWAELRPGGNVDLMAEVTHVTGSGKPSINVAVYPRPESTTIQPKFFPYRMEQLAGTFSYRDGKVVLSQLRASHGRTQMRTNGDGEFRNDGSWRVRLEGLAVDRLMARRDLTDALPTQLQKLIEFLRPTGSFNLSNSTLEFAKAAGPNAQVNSAWDVQLNCLQANLQAGIELHNIHGAVRLKGKSVDGKNESAGELAIDTATFQDVQFTEIQGPLWVGQGLCLFGEWATKQQGLPLRRLTARVYDGFVTADSWVSFDVVPEYAADAKFTDVNLSRLMRERVNGELDYQGKLEASLSINGKGRSLATLVGHGEVQITEANIYELPILVSMLKVLRNETPDSTAFNQVNSKFRIQGPIISLDQLDFKGDAVSLLGRGETNFDQQLNLDFHPVVGRDEIRLPFVKNIVKGAGRQTLEMSVTGTLSNPQVSRQALPGINQLIKQLEIAPSEPPTPRAAERGSQLWPRRGLQ